MAVTVAAAARALRIDDPAAEEVSAELTRLITAAGDAAIAYVAGADGTAEADAWTDIAEGLRDEAVIRMIGYAYDRDNAPAGTQSANWIRNSGAGAILSPFKPRRLVTGEA